MLKSSCLLSLCPILDNHGILHMGGRLEYAKLHYSAHHPAILSGKHKITKLIIYAEHICLLHAGPTLVNSSLGRCYGARKSVHSVTHNCIICRQASAKPDIQMLGQLPAECLIPGGKAKLWIEYICRLEVLLPLYAYPWLRFDQHHLLRGLDGSKLDHDLV